MLSLNVQRFTLNASHAAGLFSFVLFTLAGLTSVTTIQAEEWPHWRGPQRSDVTSEPSGYTAGKDWPAAKPLWTVYAGKGSGSMVVAGGRMYVMGFRNRKEYIYCVDAASGNVLWKQSYRAPEYGRHAIGDKGQYGGPSNTPEFDTATGMLFTLGTDGQLCCWDTNKEGAQVWTLNLYDQYQVKQRPDVGRRQHRDYGYSTAPLVHGDWVLVEVGDDDGTVMAFSKKDGRRVWASEAKEEAGHTGGLVPMTVEGVPCVAVLTLRNLLVIRLDGKNAGRTVAKFKWTTVFANNIPTPAVQGDEVLITTSYNHGEIVKLKISLQGAREVWRQKMASGVCSPVIHKGKVYWAWRGVHCLDFETGKVLWSGGRVGTVGSCIITGDDRMIVWSNRGNLSLVETAVRSPEKYQQIAQAGPLFKVDVWPHIVLAAGRLYCKDRDGNIICLATGS